MSRTSYATRIGKLDLNACQSALILISQGIQYDLALQSVEKQMKKINKIVSEPEQRELPI